MAVVAEIGSVVLAVLTFKRPEDLAEVVPQLVHQGTLIEEPVSVLVIDNDPAGSARALVEGLDHPQVRYVHESAPGIANARNRALDEAGDAHLLVFIDDDERPSPEWLPQLVATYRRTGSAGVAGPVIPDYSVEPDSWIVAGGFFVRKRYATGTSQPAASTANLLLDLHQVEAADHLRFDPRFGLSGGSDTLFTLRLREAGGALVWCDEASVLDHVPAKRLTRRWVLQRAFRSGNSWSLTTLEIKPAGPAKILLRVRLTVEGVARVVGGAGRGLVGLLTRSEVRQARGSRTVARGLGMTTGAWGIVYQEYLRMRKKSNA